MRNALILITLVVILAACSSTGPLFERVAIDESSNPLLYLYRQDSGCMERLSIDFLIDGTQILTLGGNEYGYVFVTKGENIIVAGAVEKEDIPSLKIMIKTEQGKEYYVTYEATCESEYLVFQPVIRLRLKQIDEVKALSKISSLHLAPRPVRMVDKKGPDRE